MWTWGWLFGKNDEESLNDNIITEEDFYETEAGEKIPTKDLPHDFDTKSWWNIFDWGDNYDKSLDAYYERKSEEKASQNRIYFYIVAGLFGIYLIRR